MLDFGEDLIRENSSPESFRRGEDYYRRNCVTSLIRRGEELRAEVVGSQFAPYDVRVSFDEASIMAAWCSCPYDWGGFCKHIVATLLCAIRESETVQELPGPRVVADTVGEFVEDVTGRQNPVDSGSKKARRKRLGASTGIRQQYQ